VERLVTRGAALIAALSAALMASLVACTDTAQLEPTGATCPSDSTLTYANFGEPFMTEYCTECHSSDLTGDERMGAPLFHDFNTLEGIMAFTQHIDETAAAGPKSVNTLMPQFAPKPSLAERYQLGEWLACGTPP
jgi:hypothetical protein